MTLEQFLDELSNLPELTRSKVAAYMIYGQIGCQCPIAAVYGHRFSCITSNAEYMSYARELGLDETLAFYIAQTADSKIWAKNIREAMLEKLGAMEASSN